MSKRKWDVERIGADLHGEIGSMDSKESDEPWMWRLMLGSHVVDFGRAKSREDVLIELQDAWENWDERLDAM